MNKEEIYKFCKNLSKKENVEFIFSEYETESVSLDGFKISDTRIKEAEILNIKVIYNNSFGEYKVNHITKDNILKGITNAKKNAKLKKSEIKIKDFGKDKETVKINYPNNIKEISFPEIIEKVKKELKKEKYIKSYSGKVSKNISKKIYINPHTKFEVEKSSLYLGVLVNTKDKNPSSGDYGNIFTRKEDINISETFNQARINAFNQTNPQPGEKGKYTLILIPEMTSEFIEELILEATNGSLINKKESYLHNFKNKQIFSKGFSIMEKPHLDYFLSSQAIDDEGFKTTEKIIFENGIFKTEIYDQYNSIKYNKKPTGNGFRETLIETDYTNIIQKPGTKKIEDIISSTKKGLLVYSIIGFHTNNLVTGNFSLTVLSAKEIVNGKFSKTITNLTFSGDLKTILKNISFSREQKFFGDSLYSFSVIPNVSLI